MEHELLQSKLKPPVDSSLVSDITRSISSGTNSYRAAAMELIIERSIQKRRERNFTKAENSLRPDPTPQPKIEMPNTPAPQVRSPAPAPASQPPPPPDDATTSPASASAKHEASRSSSSPSKPAKKTKKVKGREETPRDTKSNASRLEEVTQLVCRTCHNKQLRSDLRSGVHCIFCFWPSKMKCVGCGVFRVGHVEARANCYRKFE